MNILLIGKSGEVGKIVAQDLKNFSLVCPSKKDLDLSDIQSLKNFSKYRHKFDCIINCSGQVPKKDTKSIDYFDKNVIYVVNIIEHLLHTLNHNGFFINISSIMAFHDVVGDMLLYKLSKIAVNNYIEKCSKLDSDHKYISIMPLILKDISKSIMYIFQENIQSGYVFTPNHFVSYDQ